MSDYRVPGSSCTCAVRRLRFSRQRWGAMLLLCVAIQLIAPARADAWFAWLDQLSGPGPYHGLQFEFRVACFGKDSDANRLARRYAAAKLHAIHLTPSSSPENLESIRALQELVIEFEHARSSFPVFNKAELDLVISYTVAVDSLLSALYPVKAPAEGKQPTNEQKLSMIGAVQQTLKNLDKPIHTANIGVTALGSTGVFWSMCSTDKTRGTSFDIGTTFWRTIEDSSDFAGGKPVRLLTLIPSISWRVFLDPRFDVLDAGAGGGVYWFTSAGFEEFKGIVLQPGRLDFHAPTRWSTYDLASGTPLTKTLKVLARVTAIFNLRYAVMSFPSGFAANAFAGSGARSERIPAELNQTWTIFLNLKPLAHRTRATD
jgi:hypothetical protein